MALNVPIAFGALDYTWEGIPFQLYSDGIHVFYQGDEEVIFDYYNSMGELVLSIPSKEDFAILLLLISKGWFLHKPAKPYRNMTIKTKGEICT